MLSQGMIECVFHFSQIQEVLLKTFRKKFWFIRAFIQLGLVWDIDDAMLSLLEEYLCNLFR